MKQFFATMDKLRPIYDMTDKIVMTICKLLLVADIIITGYSVLGPVYPIHHLAVLDGGGCPDPDELHGRSFGGHRHPPQGAYPDGCL